MNIRILLADDHAIVRQGLRSMLEQEPNVTVVAEAGDGRTAVKLTRTTQPDIVIMDVSMPDLNGIEATRPITSDFPGIKVIGLSMHSEKKFVGEMLRAGASAFVLKNDAAEELIAAIHKVIAGAIYLSPMLAANLVTHYTALPHAPAKGSFGELSSREREVLQLIAEGSSNKDIARKLGVSEKTVSAHREHIMEKLGLHNVVELTRYALREGITRL